MITRSLRPSRRRSLLAGAVAVTTSAAATLTFIPLSNAADGTGVYAAWTVNDSRIQATGTFTGTVFPQIDVTAADGTLAVARSATLTGTTPFGEEYGTSRNQQYLTSAIAAGKPRGTVTLTFATPPNPLTWSFAIGDVDAENVALSATDTSGRAIDVREWKYVPFNYASGGTDQPVWDAATQTIVGNVQDTDGATMWVRPTTRNIATITLTQIRQSGFPQYQLWVAADVLTEADVAEPEVNDNVCTVTDTALVNGNFELPIIPARTFRQLDQRDVPGWDTTASDRKIEIWSTGFQSVVAQEGNQFAELNATQPSELYQVVETKPGEKLTWSLLHRARGAGAIGDTMSVNIGPEGAAPNATYTFTDALPEGWVRHTGEYTVPSDQTRTRFGFESGPTASGSRSIGNFLDDIYFTTTECIPADKTGGNTVVPEVSPSASPSPSVSPTASPSPSVSPTASPSPSVSPTASPSPTVSPTASPSPTVSPTASPSPTVSPTASPTAPAGPTAPTGPTAPIENPEPVPVPPNRSVVIDPVTDGGTPSGSTVTSVEPNDDGKVRVKDGDIVFVPNDGFIGDTEVRFTVVTPDGQEREAVVTVSVGKEQRIITRWTAPKKLVDGLNKFGPGTFMTNAMQPADVSVECLRILRINSGKPDPKCSVVVGKDGTFISVKTYEPTAVIVTVSAPRKGQFRPLNEEFVYRVGK